MDNIIKEAVKELEAKLSGSVCEIIKNKIDEATTLQKELDKNEKEFKKLNKTIEEQSEKIAALETKNKRIEILENEIQAIRKDDQWRIERDRELAIREATIERDILQKQMEFYENRMNDFRQFINAMINKNNNPEYQISMVNQDGCSTKYNPNY